MATKIPLIQSAIDDSSSADDPIPIPQVSLPSFLLVKEFLEKKEPVPEIPHPMEKPFHMYIKEDTWLYKFIPKEKEKFITLYQCAHYLGIKDLENLICPYIAQQIIDRTKDEC